MALTRKPLAAVAIGTLGLAAATGVAGAATKHTKRHHTTAKSKKSTLSSTTTPGSTTTARPNPEQPLTGDAKTQAEAAALAAVPGGTVWRSSSEDAADPSGAAYEVHVTKTDGSEVEVLEDASFKVLAINASRQKAGDHGGHGRGDHDGDGPRADGGPDTDNDSGATATSTTGTSTSS